MKVHLIDGTYELFRAFFAVPAAKSPSGGEVSAVRGLVRTLISLLGQPGVTHVACAFDHVIESFRNRLYAGYKTSEGVPADLLSQFPLAERATRALGIERRPGRRPLPRFCRLVPRGRRARRHKYSVRAAHAGCGRHSQAEVANDEVYRRPNPRSEG